MNRQDRKEDLKSKIRKYGKELATLTDKAKFSEEMQNYFNFVSKFYKYSWHNRILIYSQCPNASLISGFNTWKNQFERNVKKGSSAIWIYAPRFIKENVEILEKDGVKEIEEIKHIYFVPVPVFDLSQTDGKPIPEIDFGSDTNKHSELLKQMETGLTKDEITLLYKPMGKLDYGYTDGELLAINSKISDDDKLRTIFHEYAHFKLHCDKDRGTYTKKQKETEAEATAFIICRFLKIDTKAYNYLALYNSDSELILNSLQRISKAVSGIMKHFNGEIKEENKQVINVTC